MYNTNIHNYSLERLDDRMKTGEQSTYYIRFT